MTAICFSLNYFDKFTQFAISNKIFQEILLCLQNVIPQRSCEIYLAFSPPRSYIIRVPPGITAH